MNPEPTELYSQTEPETPVQLDKKKGISGSTLKMIALITMLIDHFAATIIERSLLAQHISPMLDIQNMQMNFSSLQILYWTMRLIGRLGFPIYIFLLIEGFQHTHNKWKYLLRLILFALVSEIPFDIAFNLSRKQVLAGQLLESSYASSYQNVFFTLSIGLLTIILMDLINQRSIHILFKIIINILISIAGMILADLLHTDYSSVGVLAIVVMYLLRNKQLLGTAMTCFVLMCSSIFEATALLILIPVKLYNGSRGWNLEWIFYAFYPVHLLILGLACILMGI